MAEGLPVSRLINVDVILQPLAAQFLNFDTLLIVGDSDVIDVGERLRLYGGIDEVAADFSTTDPEYLAALNFFGQVPTPTSLYIGRWAHGATPGLLRGGIIPANQQVMTNFTGINNGGFHVAVDGGVVTNVTGIDLTAAANLNQVAGDVTTRMAAAGLAATCTWDGERFRIRSGTTGINSSVSFLTAPIAGTDISGLLKGTAATGGVLVQGHAAETMAQATVALDALSTRWYGLAFASPDVDDASHLAVAAFIQASQNPHIYGVTITNVGVLDSTVTNDLASQLRALGYTRTVAQYSQNPYAVASLFGRAFTTNFQLANSMITLMYKAEPGVAPESLSSDQAATLEAKRCNVFVQYNNNTAIVEDGFMSGPAFFDEIHGLDWLANQMQTNAFNLLYTSPKVPQTDAGTHMIEAVLSQACDTAINNGLIGPGTWNSPGFGQLKQGDFLATGFYIYAPKVATQAQADREARKSVPIKIAAKLAGAVHSVDIQINVNR